MSKCLSCPRATVRVGHRLGLTVVLAMRPLVEDT